MFRLPFLVWVLALGGREEPFVILSRLFHLVQIIVRSCPQKQRFWCVCRDFFPGGKILQHLAILMELRMSKGQAPPGVFIVRIGRSGVLQNGNGGGKLLGINQALRIVSEQTCIVRGGSDGLREHRGSLLRRSRRPS